MASESENALRAAYEDARRRWPGLDVSFDGYRSTAHSCAAPDDIHTLHLADLYLAIACLGGQRRAIETFEREILMALRPSVERACRDALASVDDVLQVCRERLLMPSGGQPPKLAQYRGRGPLQGWVRVVTLREALQERRRSSRTKVVDPTSLLDGSSIETGLELEFLRKRYGAAFREAVHEGLRRLTAEQRALLKLHTTDGLSIDQLAPLLGVHRATAARRLERAREDGLTHTRDVLCARHGLSPSEARSLCLALAEDLDVSIARDLDGEAT